jgi:hypothetical protein
MGLTEQPWCFCPPLDCVYMASPTLVAIEAVLLPDQPDGLIPPGLDPPGPVLVKDHPDKHRPSLPGHVLVRVECEDPQPLVAVRQEIELILDLTDVVSEVLEIVCPSP